MRLLSHLINEMKEIIVPLRSTPSCELSDCGVWGDCPTCRETKIVIIQTFIHSHRCSLHIRE